MGWSTVAAALQTEIAAIPDIGPVYLGDLHLRDATRFADKFRAVFLPAKAKYRIRGCRIVRESIAEEWWSTQRTKATERYKVRMATAVTGDTDSEATFQALADAVWLRLRNLTTIGDALVIGAAETPAVEFLELCGILCHYAEVGLEVIDHPTIVPAAQPGHVDSLANRRDSYSSVAEQIASYLALAEPNAKVLEERRTDHEPEGWTDADRMRLYEVDADTPSKRRMQAWTVYRASDAEDRQIGQRVEASSAWRALYWRSWYDAGGSYDAFQLAIDAARAVFRGVGCLGNALNPTQTLSGPLQFREIGARMVMNQLCHFAEAELRTDEVVHARTA